MRTRFYITIALGLILATACQDKNTGEHEDFRDTLLPAAPAINNERTDTTGAMQNDANHFNLPKDTVKNTDSLGIQHKNKR